VVVWDRAWWLPPRIPMSFDYRNPNDATNWCTTLAEMH
jgi:hypothetical protein